MTTVLGLGNAILGDDAAGLHVVRRLAGQVVPSVELLEAECGGLALLDWLRDRRRVFLVDAILTPNCPPGSVVRALPTQLRGSARLGASHDMSLSDVLRLGAQMGHRMPESLVVFGISIRPARTFSEALSPEAERGVRHAVEQIASELQS